MVWGLAHLHSVGILRALGVVGGGCLDCSVQCVVLLCVLRFACSVQGLACAGCVH